MEKKKSILWKLFWFLGKIIGLLLLANFIKNKMGKEKCVCDGEVCEPEECGPASPDASQGGPECECEESVVATEQPIIPSVSPTSESEEEKMPEKMI